MSSEAKWTKGKWHWDSDPIKNDPLGRVRYRVTTIGKTITQCYYSSDDEHAKADAQLIAEAGTVANETGLTPRQLADQRAELVEALQTDLLLFEALAAASKHKGDDNFVGYALSADRIRAILAKCGQQK